MKRAIQGGAGRRGYVICSKTAASERRLSPVSVDGPRTRVNKSPGFDKVEFEKYVSSGFRWPTTSALGAVLLALQLVTGILTSSSLNIPFSKYQQSAGGHWDYEVSHLQQVIARFCFLHQRKAEI